MTCAFSGAGGRELTLWSAARLSCKSDMGAHSPLTIQGMHAFRIKTQTVACVRSAENNRDASKQQSERKRPKWIAQTTPS
jgi:hypothetical protein